MKDIKNTDQYSIALDIRKNILRMSLKGNWRNTYNFKVLYDDIHKACKRMQEGFALILDLQEYELQTKEIEPVQLAMMQVFASNGCDQCVFVEGNSFVNFQMQKIANQVQLPTYNVKLPSVATRLAGMISNPRKQMMQTA